MTRAYFPESQDTPPASRRQEDRTDHDQRLAPDEFEEIHRWWQDTLQDLDNLRDVLLASLGDVVREETADRLQHALGLVGRAYRDIEALAEPFSPEVKRLKEASLMLQGCKPEMKHYEYKDK